LSTVFSKAPGFHRVNVLSFKRTPGPTARLDIEFDKSDVEEKEKQSSLSLEEAIVRWFSLDAVNEKYDTSDYGIPVVLTGIY